MKYFVDKFNSGVVVKPLPQTVTRNYYEPATIQLLSVGSIV